jgi:uncharacterized protein YggE
MAVLGLLLGAISPVLFGPSMAGAASTTAAGEPNTVSDQGSATISLAPDEALFSLGVQTRGETASAAVERNASRMNAVIRALKDIGIVDDDIVTTGFSLYPRYHRRTFVGYSASNSVSVTIHRLGMVGRAIDAGVEAGATFASGVRFAVSDRNKGVNEALAAAVKDARSKARAMATAAGGTLGGPISIQESSRHCCYGGSVPSAAGGGAGGAPTPINPGPVQTTVHVSVVWQLQ